LKIDKCPEIITGVNFHFETVELCILRKIPSSDDSANILELLNTFLSILLNKNYYNLGKLCLLTV